MKFFPKVVVLFALLSRIVFPQFTEFHPELKWFTIKGEHVEVHYHEGAERTAITVAKIADEVWGPITSLYQYEPQTVHFVIKDIDDYSNGATYFFDNKIEIWTSALDFDLRGTHNWLRNVISHEFTHMVQIQSSMKATRTLPAAFLQVMSYEDERRPDILYGFPNIVASYPIATINVPSWFAEGTAQYMRKELDYERWDSHRDMILRSYALDNKMLSWNEMGVFGKTSLGNESVYNAGFALTKFIAQKYGEDKLREICRALGKWKNWTMDAAFKDVLGKDGDQIYSEWKSFTMAEYKKKAASISANKVEGSLVTGEGFGNFYPMFSKDKAKIYFISNKGSDYFSPSCLYERDLKTNKETLLIENVRSTYAFIPGTNKIVYAKISDDNKNWYNVHDLYVYDVDKKEEKRLTFNLRANQPSVSNNGKLITYLFQKDGTTNVGVVDIDGKNNKAITGFLNGEQAYNPKFAPNDSSVVFDVSYHHNRSVAMSGIYKYNYEYLVTGDFDARNPVFDAKGNLIYASDETGIYNIYSMDLKTKEKRQLTNVLGGAFMPAVDNEGNVSYSGYTSNGYKIFYLPTTEQVKVDPKMAYVKTDNPPMGEDKPNGDIGKFNIDGLKKFNDYMQKDYKIEPYKGAFSSLTFYPFIRYDNYNTSNKFLEKLKPGVYVSSSDMLNRYDIFAGGSLNARFERDLFFSFNYRNKLPLLFDLGIKPELTLELYSISRKATSDILFNVDSTYNPPRPEYTIPTDVTYNLFEVDLAAKHRIFSRAQNIEFRYIFSRYSASIGSFTLPDENRTLYPTSSDTYLIGSNFQVKYTLDAMVPGRNEDINPLGVKAELQYNYELNKFNNQGNYTVEDGVLKPLYNHFNFHRLEINLQTGIGLFGDHSLTAKIRAGAIINKETMPDFFDFYLGGLIGMKAYPFYAISGNRVSWLNLTYRFPLFQNIDYRLGHLYIDKIFMSVYGDAGNAWNGNNRYFDEIKKGLGTELRLQMISYYIFPTSIFFNASYGLDSVERIVRGNTIKYGKEWRFYGGVLFGFDY